MYEKYYKMTVTHILYPIYRFALLLFIILLSFLAFKCLIPVFKEKLHTDDYFSSNVFLIVDVNIFYLNCIIACLWLMKSLNFYFKFITDKL